MAKTKRILSLLLFFLPAILNTLVVLWIFVYPWLDTPAGIGLPWQMSLVLFLFWLSGLLLAIGKWYGGVPAAASPVFAYLQSLSGYAGLILIFN